MPHAGIKRPAVANHRRRMLGAEEPDGEVDQWNVKGPKNGDYGRDHGGLAAGRESPQHQVADVNQPEYEGGGEPNITGRPPDAPNRARPDGAGDNHHGAEHDPHFGAYQG